MDSDLSSASPSSALPKSPWHLVPKALFLGGLLSLVGLFLTATPGGLLEKAKLIGFALCHQIPERSFFFHEHQAPLCARCTGIYLGMALGLVFLVIRRRTRASRLPPVPIVATLILFIIAMGIDGVNSTISIIPGAPQLYHTTNLHRIITGTLCGVAISVLFLPYFSTAVWREVSGERTLQNGWELLVLLLVTAAVIVLVASTPDWLLYPITIISVAGPLLLLSFMVAVVWMSTRQKDSAVSGLRQMIIPMIFGLACSLILITLMDILRSIATTA